jgi:hypothetical protein
MLGVAPQLAELSCPEGRSAVDMYTEMKDTSPGSKGYKAVVPFLNR